MERRHPLHPIENAFDSLSHLVAAFERPAAHSLLKPALVWGCHAFHLLAIQRLRSNRTGLPGWLQERLHCGDPELRVARDSAWLRCEIPTLLELVDLLSAPPLPCVAPELHRGWEDRQSSCLRLREQAQAALGTSLQAIQRDHLLLLLAARNRLLLLPCELSFTGAEIWNAYPLLLDLLSRLAPDGWSAALALSIERIRLALPAGP